MQRIKSTILIGGTLSSNLVPEFCDLIVDNMAAIKQGGPDFKPKDVTDLLGACTKIDGVNTLQLFTPDGVLGGFPVIEIFALRHKLDYTLQSGGYLINRPFLVEHRGLLNFYYKADANQDFEPLIDSHVLEELKHCESQEEIQCILSDALPEIPPREEFFIKSPQHRKE